MNKRSVFGKPTSHDELETKNVIETINETTNMVTSVKKNVTFSDDVNDGSAEIREPRAAKQKMETMNFKATTTNKNSPNEKKSAPTSSSSAPPKKKRSDISTTPSTGIEKKSVSEPTKKQNRTEREQEESRTPYKEPTQPEKPTNTVPKPKSSPTTNTIGGKRGTLPKEIEDEIKEITSKPIPDLKSLNDSKFREFVKGCLFAPNNHNKAIMRDYYNILRNCKHPEKIKCAAITTSKTKPFGAMFVVNIDITGAPNWNIDVFANQMEQGIGSNKVDYCFFFSVDFNTDLGLTTFRPLVTTQGDDGEGTVSKRHERCFCTVPEIAAFCDFTVRNKIGARNQQGFLRKNVHEFDMSDLLNVETRKNLKDYFKQGSAEHENSQIKRERKERVSLFLKKTNIVIVSDDEINAFERKLTTQEARVTEKTSVVKGIPEKVATVDADIRGTEGLDQNRSNTHKRKDRPERDHPDIHETTGASISNAETQKQKTIGAHNKTGAIARPEVPSKTGRVNEEPSPSSSSSSSSSSTIASAEQHSTKRPKRDSPTPLSTNTAKDTAFRIASTTATSTTTTTTTTTTSSSSSSSSSLSAALPAPSISSASPSIASSTTPLPTTLSTTSPTDRSIAPSDLSSARPSLLPASDSSHAVTSDTEKQGSTLIDDDKEINTKEWIMVELQDKIHEVNAMKQEFKSTVTVYEAKLAESQAFQARISDELSTSKIQIASLTEANEKMRDKLTIAGAEQQRMRDLEAQAQTNVLKAQKAEENASIALKRAEEAISELEKTKKEFTELRTAHESTSNAVQQMRAKYEAEKALNIQKKTELTDMQTHVDALTTERNKIKSAYEEETKKLTDKLDKQAVASAQKIKEQEVKIQDLEKTILTQKQTIETQKNTIYSQKDTLTTYTRIFGDEIIGIEAAVASGTLAPLSVPASTTITTTTTTATEKEKQPLPGIFATSESDNDLYERRSEAIAKIITRLEDARAVNENTRTDLRETIQKMVAKDTTIDDLRAQLDKARQNDRDVLAWHDDDEPTNAILKLPAFTSIKSIDDVRDLFLQARAYSAPGDGFPVKYMYVMIDVGDALLSVYNYVYNSMYSAPKQSDSDLLMELFRELEIYRNAVNNAVANDSGGDEEEEDDDFTGGEEDEQHAGDDGKDRSNNTTSESGTQKNGPDGDLSRKKRGIEDRDSERDGSDDSDNDEKKGDTQQNDSESYDDDDDEKRIPRREKTSSTTPLIPSLATEEDECYSELDDDEEKEEEEKKREEQKKKEQKNESEEGKIDSTPSQASEVTTQNETENSKSTVNVIAPAPAPATAPAITPIVSATNNDKKDSTPSIPSSLPKSQEVASKGADIQKTEDTQVSDAENEDENSDDDWSSMLK